MIPGLSGTQIGQCRACLVLSIPDLSACPCGGQVQVGRTFRGGFVRESWASRAEIGGPQVGPDELAYLSVHEQVLVTPLLTDTALAGWIRDCLSRTAIPARAIPVLPDETLTVLVAELLGRVGAGPTPSPSPSRIRSMARRYGWTGSDAGQALDWLDQHLTALRAARHNW